MYAIFEELCENKGVSAYRVAQETGVTTSTLTAWKQGKYEPKRDKLQKLADYFGVPIDYIENGKMNGFSDEDAKLVAMIRSDKKLSEALIIYSYLSEEKKDHVLKTIRLLNS